MSIMKGTPPTGVSRMAKHQRGPGFALIHGDQVEFGPCPDVFGEDGPLESTVATWDRVTQAPHLAAMIQTTADLDVLHEYIQIVDVAERALRVFRVAPIVDGTTREVVNPAWRVYQDAIKQKRGIEDRFGFSLLSRARLGVEVGAAAKGMGSVMDLFKQVAAAEADGPADPRLSVVDVVEAAGG